MPPFGMKASKGGSAGSFLQKFAPPSIAQLPIPRQYRRLRRRPEVRRVLTRRFPYCIFFILSEDAIVVFRVLHGARHDRNWKQTLRE